MAADPKALVRDFFERLINDGDTAVVDELLAPDYVDHAPQDEGAGVEGFKRRVAVLRECFGMRLTVDVVVAEDDRVAFAWTMTGRHVGAFAGVDPTQRDVTLTGLNLERVAGGRIVEHWSEYDRLGLLAQVAPERA
jgi:predicted ester cyclase